MGIGRACRAWVWRSLGACSRVSGARARERVVGYRARVCLGMVPGIGRECAWVCVRAWVWRSLAGGRVVGYQARVCLGMAEPVGCVVGHRARVSCLGMAEPWGV